MVASQNIFFVAVKKLFLDIIFDALYFPIWWYTVGLKHIAVNRIRSILDMSDHLALRLLILNIFKPMFAQYDRTGRIISFFMRIVILIARSIYFVIYAGFQAVLFIVWVLLPVLIFFRLVSIYATWYVT